ncbi:MAG: exo-alpha-sialidase [Ruminococcaceae bacterium]|nr:exo-alpha-sialidase [Oscillospiraceae bacterium]
MSFKEIIHNNYKVKLEAPEIYVNNEVRGRSGHMSHAMAEFAPGCFIEFNSNCSAVRLNGHSAFGFVEYRISEDAGKTYSDVYELEYSKKVLMDGINSISVEKAVVCDNGDIIAFCLRNTQRGEVCCEPWHTPQYLISHDKGKTWSEPFELCPYEGRTYDACCYEGDVYALNFCNPNFLGSSEEHKFRIYKSSDNGKNFSEWCTVPFDTNGRGYGAMIFDHKGALHVYTYNSNAECEMDHAVSYDKGKSWQILKPCHLAQGIRNPQIGYIDGVYILHGRAGELKGFVMYTSEDAENWDEGCLVVERKGIYAFYSENITLADEKGSFMLIQYSDIYGEVGARVNAMHLKLRVER